MTAMGQPTDDLTALTEQVTKLVGTTNKISKALGAAAGKLADAGSSREADSPSLDLVLDQVAAEREAINAHTDSLTTKAGLVLGFAGILVGLSATAQQVDFSSFYFRIGLWAAVLAALLAAVALVPLSRYPKLNLDNCEGQLSDTEGDGTGRRPEYKIATTQAEDAARIRLLRFQVAMVKKARCISSGKQWLVSGSVLCLFGAAGLVVAGTLLAGGSHLLW